MTTFAKRYAPKDSAGTNKNVKNAGKTHRALHLSIKTCQKCRAKNTARTNTFRDTHN